MNADPKLSAWGGAKWIGGGDEDLVYHEGRRGLLNFRRLSRAQDASIAGGLANNLFLGRTFAVSQRVDEALGALTLEQVNDALRRYLKPQALATAVAGDFKTP